MKWILILFLVPFFVYASEGKKLSVQSRMLLEALKEMPGKGDITFLSTFPDTKKEFIKICHSPKFDELYDCNKLFYPHIDRLITSHPLRVGEILAGLASSIKYDADAPSYLQDAWLKLCLRKPGYFVKSLEKLKSKKRQNLALKYLNESLHHPRNQISKCIDVLKKHHHGKWVELAKKYLHNH